MDGINLWDDVSYNIISRVTWLVVLKKRVDEEKKNLDESDWDIDKVEYTTSHKTCNTHTITQSNNS